MRVAARTPEPRPCASSQASRGRPHEERRQRQCLRLLGACRRRRPARHESRLAAARGAPRDRPAVRLARAVVDAEGPHLARIARQREVVAGPEAAADLQRAVDDAPDRLGDEDLGDGRFVRSPPPASSTSAQVRISPRPASMSITLSATSACTMPCSSSGRPNASRVARAVERDVERAPRETEPAHAVRQPRGRETHLGVAKPRPTSPSTASRRHAAAVEDDLAVPAGEGAVDRRDQALDAHAGVVGVDEEHRRALVVADPRRCAPCRSRRRPRGAGDEPLAAVDDPVAAVLPRPSSAASSGSEPGAGRRLGHRERRSAPRPRPAAAGSAPSARGRRLPRAGACCPRPAPSS